MNIYTLQAPVKIYSNAEHGSRVIFVNAPINPRDEIGKIGVNFHNSFTRLFHHTIAVNLEYIDHNNTKSTRLFYLNKKSLIQYVQAIDPASNARQKTDDQLITALHDHLWNIADLNHPDAASAKSQGDAGQYSLRHAGKHSPGLLSSWANKFAVVFGKFLGRQYQQALKSLAKLKSFFFFFARHEKQRQAVSESLALASFEAAKKSVPAYQQHLSGNNRLRSDAAFSDIPVTSKDNYIKTNAARDWDLHKNGDYPKRNKTDTSTGTTGKPTPWVRSVKELNAVKKSLLINSEVEFGKRRVEYINAFAFGPWATGMTTYEVMRDDGSVFAAGPDMEKILAKLENIHSYQTSKLQKAVMQFLSRHQDLVNANEQVTEILSAMVENLFLHSNWGNITRQTFPAFSKYYSELQRIAMKLNADKPVTVITGYPPFLKDLVSYAASKKIDFKKYHAHAVVGGQAISEAARDKLIEGGFDRVNSSYGASDLDINIGVETDFEIGLRKAVEQNPGLARELYGSNKGLPMIFRYDPLNYHIEVQPDDELIFTCNRNDRSSPRVRYDLGDKGRVYTVSDIEALLLKYGIHHLKPKTNLPLLFVWGRDAEVNYAGAKVGFTDLERAVNTEDQLGLCLKYAFYSYEDHEGIEQFDIWLELKDGIALPDERDQHEFLTRILIQMAKSNQDFAYQLRNMPIDTELAGIRCFPRKTSPIQDADGLRKQVLVFKRGKNLDQDYMPPAAAQRFAINMTRELKDTINNELNGKQAAVVKPIKRQSSTLFQPAPVTPPPQDGMRLAANQR